MADVQSNIEFINRTYDRYIVVYSVLLGLATCSVSLRLYSRWTSSERKAWGKDDVLILPALISFWVFITPSIGKTSGIRTFIEIVTGEI